MLINVMANNVMLSKNIQRSNLLKNHLKALNISDYCFELSPHDFGGPPPLYVHHQLEEINKETTQQHYIGHQLQQLLQQLQQNKQQQQPIQCLQPQQNTTTTTNTSITITKNDNS